MSQDQGRPSLFAGMEEEALPQGAGQRVRILSTLESSRRPGSPARKGHASRQAKAATPHRVWLILFGIGAMSLLVSFAMVVQGERHPLLASATPVTAPLTPKTTTPAPPEEQAAPPVDAQVEQMNEPLRTLAEANTNPVVPTPESPTASALPEVTAPKSEAPTTVVKQHAEKRAPAKPRTQAASVKKHAPASSSDQDVELIEAVITHASSQPAKRAR